MKDQNKFDFDELYNEYSKLVFHIAYHKLRSRDLAEDVVQDVFLKLHSKLDMIRGKEHAKAWLIRVTSTTVVDYIRKYMPEKVLPLEENVLPPGDDVTEYSIEFWDSQKRIDEILEKMNRKNHRWYEIAVDSYIEKKSNEELSEKYHMSKNAISSLQYRIRKWLGKEILDHNQDLKKWYDRFK